MLAVVGTSSCRTIHAGYDGAVPSARGPRTEKRAGQGRPTLRQMSLETSSPLAPLRPSAPGALDAAMPFDSETRARKTLAAQNALTIGIVGFGNFGQFLAKRFVDAGHRVICTSRGDYTQEAAGMGARYYASVDDFCEAHPDVVVLATSILSLQDILKKLPVQRLRRSTLFVDVLSVKVFPKNLLLEELPREVDILCTHPMFGPDSGKGSWDGLNFMYERVRVGASEERKKRVEAFIDFFREEGCRMVEMTCEEHDRAAASTQFITHSVGRCVFVSHWFVHEITRVVLLWGRSRFPRPVGRRGQPG